MRRSRCGRSRLLRASLVLDDNGTVLYNLRTAGVVHGDRFQITDVDPNRPGLEGWAIQEDNPNGLETSYFDARTGKILREYRTPNGPGADMARGAVAE